MAFGSTAPRPMRSWRRFQRLPSKNSPPCSATSPCHRSRASKPVASAVQPSELKPTIAPSPLGRGMDASKLIVFLKAPRPGAVKTRLALSVGDAAACSAYVRLVETLLEHLTPLREVELRFSPDDAAREIRRWLRSSWSLAAQGEGELGDRLERAFRNSFDQGWSRVIVIGSDCPAVTRQDIADGWSAL